MCIVMKKRPGVEGPVESRVLGVIRESKGESGVLGRVGNLGANRESGGELGVLGEWGVLSESRVGRESKVRGESRVRRLGAGVRSLVGVKGLERVRSPRANRESWGRIKSQKARGRSRKSRWES
jgi:hypothetical protein